MGEYVIVRFFVIWKINDTLGLGCVGRNISKINIGFDGHVGGTR
jgi:hypothetical protein